MISKFTNTLSLEMISSALFREVWARLATMESSLKDGTIMVSSSFFISGAGSWWVEIISILDLLKRFKVLSKSIKVSEMSVQVMMFAPAF